MPEPFVCHHCGIKSYHPADAINRYCGRCMHFCDDFDRRRRLVTVDEAYAP